MCADAVRNDVTEVGDEVVTADLSPCFLKDRRLDHIVVLSLLRGEKLLIAE